MILAAWLGLLVLALAAQLCRRRRWALALAGLAMTGLLLAAEGPLAHALITPLQRPWLGQPAPRWQARNTIILLGAGTVLTQPLAGQPQQVLPGLLAYARIQRSLALYRDCARDGRRCQVLVSGGDPLQHGVSEAVAYGRALRALGLPAEALLEEGRSLNTRQNAAYTAALLRQQAPGQLVLVTSGYHLRRALGCFRAQGLAPWPQPADALEPGPGWLPSAYNLVLSDLAMHEWAGLLRDRILVALGRQL